MTSSLRTTMVSAPFSRAVVSAVRKLFPEALADRSWDNTGLLLEAPFDPIRRNMNSVLLTVDLTKAVVDEAIERNDSIIVAYHPIIFRGLKSLTLANSQQQSLLRLAAEGISVYCPHTAVDAAPGGLGDWLADIVTGTLSIESENDQNAAANTAVTADITSTGQGDDPFVEPKTSGWMLHYHTAQHAGKGQDSQSDAAPHTRTFIKPVTVDGIEGAGMGRIIRFEQPQPLETIIDRVTRGLGNPKGFPVAVPQGSHISDIKISSVGVCAGSGGSLFAGVDVDLLFTGELSHHEALAAIENGQCVIAPFHSNTERGFLHSVLKNQLLKTVREEWDKLREAELQNVKDEEVKEALEDDFVSVEVSERDRDPYGIFISKPEPEKDTL